MDPRSGSAIHSRNSAPRPIAAGSEVAAVSDKSALPLGHNHHDLETLLLIREGPDTNQDTKPNLAPVVGGSTVSPDYFSLLGIPLLRGRPFSDQDIEGTPQVAIINQAAARTYWPGQNPVGKHFRLGLSSGRVASDVECGAVGRLSLDHDRWRDCGCAHGIVGGRGNSRDLPQRLPAPLQRSDHLSSRKTRSRHTSGPGAQYGSIHRCRASRLRRDKTPRYCLRLSCGRGQ